MSTRNSNQFEVLKSLPAYGPMYIPINTDGEDFFSEGFVIKFYTKDGTNWVANFKTGWTNYYDVFDYPKFNIVIVIAGGYVYVMSPENKKPIVSYELAVEHALNHNNKNLIFSDSTEIFYYNIYENSLWCSERLSIDGIKDLKIHDNVLFGKTYDLYDTEEWENFSINLDTKEIKGGSFIKNNPTTTFRKKSWWKFWKKN
ncbi:hypothetical protein [Paenimyroides baculatum]|uniref:Uncharacterized protein n=1 Tax=Paenimyroides baculatum TaxID=2608000 RepID=A0A5M6CTQ5_9FLAO|nr:hypothetical protein [Paenimyroides baculatum]KAA5537750.1 hypothetical protein F0460_03545 [Paenimyroides baculatum]